MTTAIVVGSGPNGLAAAVHLARAGVDVTVLEAADTIGGGTRTTEGIVPGLLHDDCSAVHQVAAASPFLASLDNGPEWLAAEVDCAHPLDDGTAGVLYQSIEQTAASLGADGRRWQQLFGTLTSDFDRLFAELTQPVLRVPQHPILFGRFGAASAVPATALGRLWRGEQTRALFAGVAAHTFHPLNRPMTSAIGLLLLAAGHVKGWVVAKGGSKTITDALAAELRQNGGSIVTGQRVSSVEELEPHDLLMLDVSPSIAAEILGHRLPDRVQRAYRRFRHGPGAFKVDFAVEEGVPWTAEPARRAGTVHLGGDAAEIVANERAIHTGVMPGRPFVLVSQQYLADPSRSVGDVHPLWTYAHVPNGYSGDATEAIEAQIERFAPGFRDRIVGRAVRSTTELSAYNPNYVGGDIIGGAGTPTQLLFRPRFAIDPYFTGVPGAYLCSASTPPGAGAHGLCGVQAATRALRSRGMAQGGE